jgi:hypothetical protein
MGSPNTDIHAPKVKQAGDDLSAAARTARKQVQHSLDSSDTVNASHAGGGWSSAKELADCAHAWENHVIDLVGEMETLGEDLRNSSIDYFTEDYFVEGLLLGLGDIGGE